MAYIKVDLARCRGTADEMQTIKTSLGEARSSLSNVSQRLQNGVFNVFSIFPILSISTALTLHEGKLDRLINALREIMDQYEGLERKLLGEDANGTHGKDDGNGGYAVDSILFDDEGSYGGNQGSMEEIYYWDIFGCWGMLAMLRLYYPDMSIMDAFHYFSRLNSSGCSYVALANTLFMQYEGRPEEFERVFGFPMYDENGDLNYNRLILDIYATTDRANIVDAEDGLPKGPTLDEIWPVYQNYLNERGIPGTAEFRSSMSADGFRAATDSGKQVILLMFHDNMYTENGSPVYINGGHAITVTGVTEDGMLVVSSWGEKYYVNPSELDHDDCYMIMDYDV